MKNAFAITCLVLTAGYAAAGAAELLGVFSLPVLRVDTFSGIYAAAGVLMLALGEYSRQPGVRARPARHSALRGKPAPKFHAPPLAGSTFGAN